MALSTAVAINCSSRFVNSRTNSLFFFRSGLIGTVELARTWPTAWRWTSRETDRFERRGKNFLNFTAVRLERSPRQRIRLAKRRLILGFGKSAGSNTTGVKSLLL